MKKFVVFTLFLSLAVFSCKTIDSETSSGKFQSSCSNRYINEAASGISSTEVSAISNLLDVACSNSNITNQLFSDDWGWEGNASNFGSYQYKYQETTQSQVLYTKTGLAMKFPKVTSINYPEILFKAYTDANWRRQYYTLPSNVRLSNVKVLSEFDGDSFSLQYTSSITNSVKVFFKTITRTTTYDTTLTFTKINDKLYAFTELSRERERNGQMTRKNISFLIRDYLDKDKIIQLEERAVYYTTDMANILPQVKTIMFSLDRTLSTSLYNAIKKCQ